MDPGILRALERILDAAIGGVSIYLGYKLFLKLPDKTDSQGKVILPGNVSIYLSRVGPGVFFALFGAAVIALSLHSAIRYEKGPAEKSVAVTDPAKEKYIGIHADQHATDMLQLESRRNEIRKHISLLNRIPGLLKPNMTSVQQDDINRELDALKLELIETVWDAQWGDFSNFKKWVDWGAEENEAEGLPAAAVRLYNQGLLKQ